MEASLAIVMVLGYVMASYISVHASNKMLKVERSSQKSVTLLLDAARLLKGHQSIEARSICERIEREWSRGN